MKSLAYWESEGALEERKARIWAMPEPPFSYEQEPEIPRLLMRAEQHGLNVELGLKWARKIMMLEHQEHGNKLRLVHVCEGLQYADYRDNLENYERQWRS